MRHPFIFLFLAMFAVAGCTEVNLASHVAKKIPNGKSEGNFKVGNPYKIAGHWYKPQEDYSYTETGIASWYGPQFHGKQTANGEIFNMNELTAAHKTLQLPSLVRVTNLENGRSVIVRVNDRGPFKRGRIIDMSKRGAELLGFKNKGTAKVRVKVLAEESRAIAEAARRGKDTRGYEVAMNDNQPKRGAPTAPTQSGLQSGAQPSTQAPRHATTGYQNVSASTKPVERAALPAPNIPGHVQGGVFYPDQIVKQLPVSSTNIYVQAGSFADRANAQGLAQRLKPFGNAQVYPAQIGGQQFYRVRIPSANVANADAILDRMAAAGNADAIIVVE